MLGFTRQEQSIVLFLLVTLFIGCGVTLYKRYKVGNSGGLASVEEITKTFVERSRAPEEAKSEDQGRNSDKGPAFAEKEAPFSGTVVSNQKININKATEEQLQSLPCIGPVMAERIINYRDRIGRFTSVEDIKRVKGIGEKTFEKIRPHISVD